MAFVNLTKKTWGSSPDIGIQPAYEMQRNGANMQYRIRVTIDAVTGQSFFGYPIYMKTYLQNSLKDTHTLKSASPSQWSSTIVYTTDWFTISNKTSGTTALSLNIYSGNGSTRNSTYSYSLPIVQAGSVLGTISNFTLGNAITIPITKYNSSFYDVLTISVGGTVVKTVNGITNGASVSFTTTELNTIYSKLPNATKGTFTFKLTTKTSSSGSSVGTSTKSATGTIPSSVKPTISGITLTEAVSGLASKFGAYIQNQSKITGTVNASAGTGSSISTYKTTINGSSYTSKTFTTGVLKTSGTNNISITVTDSRGRTSTYSTTFNVLAYSKPVISAFNVERCNADGTLNDEGTKAKITIKSTITSLNSKNNSSYLLQYKLSSVDTWTTITQSLSGYVVDTNFVASGVTLNIDNVYDFRITVSDYFEPIPKTDNVAESFTLINYNADGTAIAFGGVSEESNCFDVKLKKTNLSNDTYLGGQERNDNEKNIFFSNTGNGTNKHNVKFYGGNSESITSVGLWDVIKDLPIFQYFDGTEYRLKFGDNIVLRWGQYDIEAVLTKVFSSATGRYHTKEGLLIQWGSVSITPVANTPTSANVIFPIAYDVTPDIQVSAVSSAPYTNVLGYSHGNDSATGTTLYVTRTNTVATVLRWFAIGFKEI